MIDLYEVGRAKFKWWPDWRGQRAIIIASGPSATDYNWENLRDQIVGQFKVAVIGENIKLCPFADVLYACDEDWWFSRGPMIGIDNLKITAARNVANKYPNVRRIDVNRNCSELLFKQPGEVGSARNSGFQLFNLVLQFGASDIFLCGVDVNPRERLHWYGRNSWKGSNNPSRQSLDHWRRAFDAASRDVGQRNIRVVNLSMRSALTAYTKHKLEDVLSCRAA